MTAPSSDLPQELQVAFDNLMIELKKYVAEEVQKAVVNHSSPNLVEMNLPSPDEHAAENKGVTEDFFQSVTQPASEVHEAVSNTSKMVQLDFAHRILKNLRAKKNNSLSNPKYK